MSLLANRYRIENLVGEGGMGKVYLAHDTVLERKVAIKMLPESVQHHAHARERLRREALAAAALDHPFICKIHEVGEDEGRSFIVMEFIEGRTLNRIAREGGLTPRQLLECAHEIAQALDEAHRRGIVHRDLKPSNLMLTVHGHVKVLDFGLAKQVDPSQPGEDALTQTALTTPGRPSVRRPTCHPSRCWAAPSTPGLISFSLGTVLHELAGGRHPFLKATAPDTMASILRDPPASTVGDLDIVPGFGQVVHRMLAKVVSERYQTMGELRTALETLRDGSGGQTPWSGTTVMRSEPQERTPMVGRDAELADLTGQLDRMLMGQGGFVLLGGEPGVGKTRLAREVQRLARAAWLPDAHRAVLRAGGRRRRLVPLPRPSSSRCVSCRRQCGRRWATWRQRWRPWRRSCAGSSATSRRRPRSRPTSVAGCCSPPTWNISARARRSPPSVVLLDDLHWADEPAWNCCCTSRRTCRRCGCSWSGTYRDAELDAYRPFAKRWRRCCGSVSRSASPSSG